MEKRLLQEKRIGDILTEGYESVLFKYTDDDGRKLIYKAFRPELYSTEQCKNKERKIEILSDLNDPSLVKVRQGLFDTNGRFVGYTMDEVTGKQMAYDSKRKEKIEYLTAIRDTMIRLNNQGVFIGDFKDSNFILNEDGTVTNLDIDNYRIVGDNETLDFDTTTIYMHEYDRYGDYKELIDRYCYNIYVLALIGKYAQGYFQVSDVKRLPLVLNTPHNKATLDEMYYMGCKNHPYAGLILEFKHNKKKEEHK